MIILFGMLTLIDYWYLFIESIMQPIKFTLMIIAIQTFNGL